MTLAVLITDFLEYLELEQNASRLTIRNYSHYLKRFLEFATDINPKDIDLNLIRRYKLYLSGKPLKKVTRNFFLIALRSFLRYLERISIAVLPPEKITLWENEPRPVKILDEIYLQQLLEAPDLSKKSGLRDRAILETLSSTGLRVSELAGLNRDEVSPSFWLEKYLAIRKDAFKPLFIRFQGRTDPENNGESMRLTPRSIQRIVEKYVKKLKLPVKATPHSLSQFADVFEHRRYHCSGNR